MEYRKPSYMRVNSQEINSVEAHVVDSVGKYVPFTLGETVMLLHFRRFDVPFSRLRKLPPLPPLSNGEEGGNPPSIDGDGESVDQVVDDVFDIDGEDDGDGGAASEQSQRGQGINWLHLKSFVRPIRTTGVKRSRYRTLVSWNAVM